MEQGLSGLQYENLVSTLIQQLIGNTLLAACEISGGSKNRIAGASGYRHQIDVSINGPTFLCLVEAKHWYRSIGVESVLVLASRIADIRGALPSMTIHASIISTKQASRGALQLAPHFGIIIDVVSSMEEYVVQLSNKIFVGFCEWANVSSFMEAEVVHPPKG